MQPFYLLVPGRCQNPLGAREKRGHISLVLIHFGGGWEDVSVCPIPPFLSFPLPYTEVPGCFLLLKVAMILDVDSRAALK